MCIKIKQLSNVTCRSLDLCIHGLIHSASVIEFVSDFYSFIFFVGFYLCYSSLYFNSIRKLVVFISLNRLLVKLHQLLYQICYF